MDSSESDLIESLDYLTLPVKRSSSVGKGSGFGEKIKTRLLRDFRNKVSHKTQTSHSLHKCNDSLIFNSTKKEIVEYYAVVSETSSDKYFKYLQSEKRTDKKPKSLIKVTVTPKKPKQPNLNIFTRHKQNSKQLHNTVSVEDRSNQTKHMCLVVTGRKRERQYNIKTTESAKLLNDIRTVNDDISLDQVKSVKHLIDSLNMDKKRKKAPSNKRPGSPPKTPKGEAKKTEKNIAENNGQSVVRITGQIGLGEDNHLMMRCGVEGTKVPRNIEVKEYHPSNFGEHIAGTLLHTVTQGTQMDIGVVDSPLKKSVPYYSNNMTCFCHNVNEHETLFNDHAQVKKCQSPLVVITVYPNDERCENVKIFKHHTQGQSSLDDMCASVTNLNFMQQSNRFNQYQVDEEYVDKNKKETVEGARKRRPRSVSRSGKGKKTETKHKRDSSQPRSRSRSTNSSSSQNFKGRGPKKIDNAFHPKSPRNLSPIKHSAQYSKPKETENRHTRSKTQSPDINNQNVKRQEGNTNISNKNKKEEKYGKSPSLSRSQSPSINYNHNVKRQNTEKKKLKKQEPIQRGFQKKEKEARANLTSTATNTDHVLTKKALVDSFTKELMGQMGKHNKKDNCKKTQYTESQLEINIEGDNENYDVYLQQGRMSTDVRVKKTMKCPEHRNTERFQEFPDPDYCRDGTSKSLLNMIDMDDFRDTYKSAIKNEIFEHPEIKVRDSLEIGHKRKDRSPRNTREEDFERDFENHLREQTCVSPARESFAPIKHYKGDKCLISDPVKRDKEVRQLLGLESKNNECCPCSHPMHRHKNYESVRTCELFYANDNFRTRKTKDAPQDTTRTNQINYKMRTVKQTTGTQYDCHDLDCPLSKKMVFNRNIQVLLQLEKFTEEKPIVLSRKQYHKVKKAIEHTIPKHRLKNKLVKPKCSIMNHESKKKVNVKYVKGDRIEKQNHINQTSSTKSKEVFASRETAVFFTRAFMRTKEKDKQEEAIARRLSIEDLRNQFLAPLNESSTKVAVGSSYSHSIHTIFKGLKKSRTPNFGTSVCSFFSNSTNEYHECKSVKNLKAPLDKPRKPFLKRLISCLILRASTVSEAKLSAMPRRQSCYNSSIDSYHISTSLGAIEMSSSIYDTSESFYSNHSIIPINSKIKKERGFFGSMRGILTGKI